MACQGCQSSEVRKFFGLRQTRVSAKATPTHTPLLEHRVPFWGTCPYSSLRRKSICVCHHSVDARFGTSRAEDGWIRSGLLHQGGPLAPLTNLGPHSTALKKARIREIQFHHGSSGGMGGLERSSWLCVVRCVAQAGQFSRCPSDPISQSAAACLPQCHYVRVRGGSRVGRRLSCG